MRLSIAVILLAACGGSSKPAEPPKQPAPAPAPAPKPVLAPAPSTGDMSGGLAWDEAANGPAPAWTKERPAPAPKPPTPPKPPLHDRLLDTDGNVAGLPGFSIKRVRDPKRCGGLAILTKRAKKIAPTDAKLADVFALEFPIDLNFTDEKRKAGSKLKFERFVETLTKTLGAAKTQYEAEFASTDPAVKAASTARLAQIYLRGASVLARAEVPLDVRSSDVADEATIVYCDAMGEQAERFIQLGNDALGACRKFTLAAPTGWWAELCKAP